MSDQHLIDFMDETGLSAEDILTVFANDELNDAEVRLAAFTSLMGIWKDEREHVRGISEKMRSSLSEKLKGVAIERLASLALEDGCLPILGRAFAMMHDIAMDGVKDVSEMSEEELATEVARMQEHLAAYQATSGELLVDTDGGNDDSFH